MPSASDDTTTPSTSHESALSVLAEAARALHGEADLASIQRWVVDAVARLSGTANVGLCLFEHDTTPSWTTHPESTVNFALLGDPRARKLIAPGLDVPSGIAYEDLRRAEATLAPSQRVRRILPVDGLAVLPILDAEGLPLGVVLAGWRTTMALEDAAHDALCALAAHAGVALVNRATLERMAEEEARGKEVAHLLQQAVRPPAPIVPFAELGVHYVAADRSAPTGGDLYDWLLLPNGALHLAIVDVMGKGVQATKDALIVTHALRTLAVDGCSLGDLVRRADGLVSAQNPELVATLLVAQFWPETGELYLAGAGHPPALRVHDGEVEELSAPGIPIGWPGAGSHEILHTRLDRSDTLILYTDGLIEARKDILRGLDDLAAAARATASYPANALARALVDRALEDAARHDDSLALVLRWRAPPPVALAHPLAPFQHQFSPNPAAVPIARHLLRDWLEAVPVTTEAVDGLLLIASELCSNAVRHASPAPGAVALHASVEGDGILLEVSDNGDGLALPVVEDPALPDPEAEQGRGLFLVRELADALTCDVRSGRTVVSAVKHAVVGE